SMFGVLAPAGTPAPIINKLSAALKDIMAQQEVKTALTNQGAMPVYTTPDQARSQINDEVARWAKVIKESDIKAD
ncbi:tripartite tricarboxylate transporter substrate-binding protein, partial [Paraburkholderia azotifigens]